MLVHETLHIDADSTGTLVENSKLRLVIKQTRHLANKNQTSVLEVYESILLIIKT